MTGTEGHLSRDVSIVIQTENTEIFYTLHFLLAHNYTTAASLQISHVFLYQGGHLECLITQGEEDSSWYSSVILLGERMTAGGGRLLVLQDSSS